MALEDTHATGEPEEDTPAALTQEEHEQAERDRLAAQNAEMVELGQRDIPDHVDANVMMIAGHLDAWAATYGEDVMAAAVKRVTALRKARDARTRDAERGARPPEATDRAGAARDRSAAGTPKDAAPEGRTATPTKATATTTGKAKT